MSVLSGLSPRERVLVLGGGALVVALLAWRFAWAPMQAERAALDRDIARYMALSQIALRAEDLRQATPATPAPTAPLAQRVTRSAEAAGVALARIEPTGGRINLTVQEAGFEALLDWIVTLETRDAARVVSLEMERLTAPGTVSARLSLEDTR